MAQFERGGDGSPEPDGGEESSPDPDDPHRSARLAPDTTLYTGVYDAANAEGYLATLSYREPSMMEGQR